MFIITVKHWKPFQSRFNGRLFCAWPLKQELIGPIAVFRDIKPCAKSSSKWWQILFAEKKIHPVPYRVVESAILLEIQRTQNPKCSSSPLGIASFRRKESSEQRFSPFGLLHHQSMVGCFCLKILMMMEKNLL